VSLWRDAAWSVAVPVIAVVPAGREAGAAGLLYGLCRVPGAGCRVPGAGSGCGKIADVWCS
jgi:hypothetical protein